AVVRGDSQIDGRRESFRKVVFVPFRGCDLVSGGAGREEEESGVFVTDSGVGERLPLVCHGVFRHGERHPENRPQCVP
ncbi:MAG: hypothetical protein ABF623_14690, partial [Gluconobacter cerinus]|uniref:hypothetical protein n=1 Tax=Gluconobacter cerinus TaxID=38307 RepID=UPI0039EB8859